MTDCLLAGVVTSMSAAKRYRLRCLKALILLLQSNDAPEIHMAQTLQDAGQTETRQQVNSSACSGQDLISFVLGVFMKPGSFYGTWVFS